VKTEVTFMEDLPHKHGPPPLSRTTEQFLLLAVALLLLVPCFWQPHIAAGDLASHSYNAWLANEVRQGRAPGLEIVNPKTNILADWALDVLLNRYGRQWAEPLIVSFAVELFFWGAFLWISVVHQRRSWLVAPSLGMLTYGLVFHFGFLNFYLATGFSLWMMYFLWRPTRRRFVLAATMAILAFLAHVLPLAWAVGMVIYWRVSQKVSRHERPMLLIGAASLFILIQVGLTTFLPSRWTLDQVFSIQGISGLVGVEQVWLYGTKYLVITTGLLLLWGILFMERLDAGEMSADPIVHLWGLNILAFIIMPAGVQLPGYDFPLLYIPQRMSLFVGVTFLAMVSKGQHGRSVTRSSALLAAVFFTALFLDVRSINRIEEQIASLLAALPPGQRVVTVLRDSGSPRLNGLVHVGSGACIGRCFDYANYEPPTKQFRIRVVGLTPVNADNMDLVRELEEGRHIVTKEEAPLYSVCSSGDEENPLVLKKLKAGDKTCLVEMKATAQLTE
jgi:hypothetical protein